jgi:hypothetical protein
MLIDNRVTYAQIVTVPKLMLGFACSCAFIRGLV